MGRGLPSLSLNVHRPSGSRSAPRTSTPSCCWSETPDQSGAQLDPLLVAGMVAPLGYRLEFTVLPVPAVMAVLLLIWLGRADPGPVPRQHSGRDRTGPLVGVLPSILRLQPPHRADHDRHHLEGPSYHSSPAPVVPDWQIPVLYTSAMGVDPSRHWAPAGSTTASGLSLQRGAICGDRLEAVA